MCEHKLPKIGLSFAGVRREGDDIYALGIREFGNSRKAFGSLGLIQLIYLGDSYNVWNSGLCQKLQHHSVIVGYTGSAINELYDKIESVNIFICREKSVGKRRPNLFVGRFALCVSVSRKVNEK